jgi:DNA-binding NarL/FixJ family response regulator
MGNDLTIPLPEVSDTPTTVLIVDDNPVVRKGLRSLLETSDRITVVGEASDGILAESMVHTLKPDIVLLDVRMPRRDGVRTAQLIADQTTVIMMTFTDEPEHIRAALAAGASGYLVHGSFDANSLVHTIQGAALGSGAFSRQALDAIRTAGLGPADPEAERRQRQQAFGLSDRQGELMELIVQGKTNAQIAGELFLAEKTVKNHINAIFGKLLVANRAEAIALWMGTADRS